jgi:hypothetical protein
MTGITRADLDSFSDMTRFIIAAALATFAFPAAATADELPGIYFGEWCGRPGCPDTTQPIGTHSSGGDIRRLIECLGQEPQVELRVHPESLA